MENYTKEEMLIIRDNLLLIQKELSRDKIDYICTKISVLYYKDIKLQRLIQGFIDNNKPSIDKHVAFTHTQYHNSNSKGGWWKSETGDNIQEIQNIRHMFLDKLISELTFDINKNSMLIKIYYNKVNCSDKTVAADCPFVEVEYDTLEEANDYAWDKIKDGSWNNYVIPAMNPEFITI